MSEEQKEETAVAVVNEQTQEIAEYMNGDWKKNLKNAVPVLTISKTNLELKEDTPTNLVFMGFSSGVDVDEETAVISDYQAVNFMDSNANMYFSRSAVLVRDLNGIQKFTSVQITYMGVKNLGGNKNLKQYKTALLN